MVRVKSLASRTIHDVIPDVGSDFIARITTEDGRLTDIPIPAESPDPLILVIPADAC